MGAINDCGFEFIQHPILPDLTPSDPVFPKAIFGTHFQSDDDIIHSVKAFLDSQKKRLLLKVALRPLDIAGKSV